MNGSGSMKAEQFFSLLNNRLTQLEKAMNEKESKSDISNQQWVREELEDLKHESETIVEEWLKFEERLGGIEQNNSQLETNEKYSNNWYKGLNVDDVEELISQVDKVLLKRMEEMEEWIKGKSFFNLQMYHLALPYLEKLVLIEPEFEPARIYLAQAYQSLDKKDKAIIQFNLIAQTAQTVEFRYHAYYSLAYEDLQAEQFEAAKKNLEKAKEELSKLDNHAVKRIWHGYWSIQYAQVLLHLQEADQCLEHLGGLDESLRISEWKIAYMMGQAYMAKGEEEKGLLSWFEALQINEHPYLLTEMARYFESKSFYQMAAQCYQRLYSLNDGRYQLHAWFGLAWNLGLNHEKQKSKMIFMKAMSLYPSAMELQYAYIWMLYYWQEKKSAEGKLARLKQLASDNSPMLQALEQIKAGRVKESYAWLKESSV